MLGGTRAELKANADIVSIAEIKMSKVVKSESVFHGECTKWIRDGRTRWSVGVASLLRGIIMVR